MPELSGEETISTELEHACADEPIHIIGTVQPHGFVMTVDIATTRIVQVSSGTARHWPGLANAEDLLQSRVTDWVNGFGADPASLLLKLPHSDPVSLPLRPYVLGDPAAPPFARPAGTRFECVGHRVEDLAVLEWEPLGDGGLPADGRQAVATITAALLRLRDAKGLQMFYRDCVREVSRVCGFDRVMLYRFLPDWTGEVVAEEAAGKLKTRFLGLRFPASDIPSQARALYASSKIRLLADVWAVPDTLMPPRLPDGRRLDQSHSLLRGFSEVHHTYLNNMGVRATMSLSIVCDGVLWGLIACHHYQPRIPPRHVRDAVRQVCELVAGVSAMRIESLSQLEAANNTVSLDQFLIRVHQLILHEENLEAALTNLLPELLTAFHASALCLRIGEFRYFAGSTDTKASISQITDEVASLFGSAPLPAATLQLNDLLAPQGVALATLPAAAGLLATQQSAQGLDFCAFTRAEVVREVNWAGEPVKQVATSVDGRARLEPRRSFAVWKQTIGGTAQAWSQPETDACGRLLRILSDACKRREHKSLEQELRWRAHHDHLTGLVNRRSMEQSLDQRLGANSYESAVMLIDLDHFKMINDTHGHAAGDRLLQDLAVRLGAAVRPSDILSRVGGDEFLLLAEMALPDHASAMAIAARLHAAVEEPFDVEGRAVPIGLSVGIAIPPAHGTKATDLLRRADLALYRAKKLGRASTVIFDAQLEEGLAGTYELERDLHDAIGKGELSLQFQPEVNLSTGRVVGLEALLRWDHPIRGSVGPNVFIPIAERSDLITRIGQWVVRTAVATQADWRSHGHACLPVAVNVSMAEVTSGKLLDTIARSLNEFQMPADCLAVELTESVIMKDPRVAMSVLNGLKRLGISTALDDFGTGYSSLSYLRLLPLACLKVDQSFTAELTRDAHSRSLTQAIIRMAEALNMITIAEGVETRGQLQWLREHRCDIGQGYYFSPAVPAASVHATTLRIESAWQLLH